MLYIYSIILSLLLNVDDGVIKKYEELFNTNKTSAINIIKNISEEEVRKYAKFIKYNNNINESYIILSFAILYKMYSYENSNEIVIYEKIFNHSKTKLILNLINNLIVYKIDFNNSMYNRQTIWFELPCYDTKSIDLICNNYKYILENMDVTVDAEVEGIRKERKKILETKIEKGEKISIKDKIFVSSEKDLKFAFKDIYLLNHKHPDHIMNKIEIQDEIDKLKIKLINNSFNNLYNIILNDSDIFRYIIHENNIFSDTRENIKPKGGKMF